MEVRIGMAPLFKVPFIRGSIVYIVTLHSIYTLFCTSCTVLYTNICIISMDIVRSKDGKHLYEVVDSSHNLTTEFQWLIH